MPERNADRATLKRIENGLRMVTVPLPHLAGLAAAVRVNLDWRVPTMGIFASGRLLVANPGFAARLKDNELVFVLAHELLHLALRTHDRARGCGRLEFNYAHDYIINDILRSELGFATIPAGGLDMPGARARSAEDIVIEMRRNADLMQSRTQVCEGKDASVRQAVRDKASGRPRRNENDAGDVLADKTEREMFPADAQDQAQCKAAIDDAIARGNALAAAIGAQKGRGRMGGGMSPHVLALRGQLRPAWQQALQRWIESVLRAGERTFARPRGAVPSASTSCCPGASAQSWMLNIVLDTSGSMTDEIPTRPRRHWRFLRRRGRRSGPHRAMRHDCHRRRCACRRMNSRRYRGERLRRQRSLAGDAHAGGRPAGPRGCDRYRWRHRVSGRADAL